MSSRHGLVIDSFDDIVPISSLSAPAEYAAALTRELTLLDRGGVDVIVVLDAFGPVHPSTGRVKVRLDPLVVAAYAMTRTRRLRFVVGTPIDSVEPFHQSKVYQSLDWFAPGRIGWAVDTHHAAEAYAQLDRPHLGAVADPIGYAAEFVDVMIGLWDTWEDGAVVRDVVASRYLDPTRVHFLHHRGAHFSVRGPSLTPRSPQGRPPIVLVTPDESTGSTVSVRADADIVLPSGSSTPEAAMRVRGPEGVRVSLTDARDGSYPAARSRLTAADPARSSESLRRWLGLADAVNPHTAARAEQVVSA